MKVAIIGSHGIPAHYGGFETFAEHLAVGLAEKGIDVSVVNEKDNKSTVTYHGIKIFNVDCNKSDSPLKYYKKSILLVRDCDVIISCGAGGSLYYNKIRSKLIITNIDGLEHLRGRYSILQKIVVRYLQRKAVEKSNFVIADSSAINEYWSNLFSKFRVKIKTIPYGANASIAGSTSLLEKYGLEPERYFLVVARLVHENNIHQIVNAFSGYSGDKKLVIVGNVNSTYAGSLNRSNKILFTGGIYDKIILDTLRENCYIYIHGHSVGGTNPSLLEAMAARCACICHDNVFNRETTDNTQLYFENENVLLNHLQNMDNNIDQVLALRSRSFDRVKAYSWEKMTDDYLSLMNYTDVKL